ncbi:TetR/AcrR family transcriptional regulator [Natrialba sp. PRR66]|uniref:TetR/AcrR family transcriptional regulator n=1 Tax=Natrialba sp. PRR66 TaxID=3098146 RepID=UPI002B1E22EC|nr:TetR/AcrR family transcriptional regulator [Natrialba sp. PRR66]
MASKNSSEIPEDTYVELIEATISAVYETGYADLGVRDIDAKFSKSRQLIHHYFDGKDELITELLVYLLSDEHEEIASSMDADPLTKLNAELDNILLSTYMDDDEFWKVFTVVYEIQAQAHHNAEHQRLLNDLTDEYVAHLSEILQDGIDKGIFNDVDPQQIAMLINDLIAGAHIRKIHLGQDEAPGNARETIDQLIVSRLLVNSSTDTMSGI